MHCTAKAWKEGKQLLSLSSSLLTGTSCFGPAGEIMRHLASKYTANTAALVLESLFPQMIRPPH